VQVFHSKTSPDAVDVISSMLAYDPAKRIPLLDVCLHPFFDSLRDTSVTLPDGGPLPELFTFTDLEIRSCPRLSTVAQEMGKRGGSLPAPAVAGAADAVGTGSSHRSSGESGAGNATAT
jgi:serine/threonine protein kinase